MNLYLPEGTETAYEAMHNPKPDYERLAGLSDCRRGEHDWHTDRRGYTLCRWCEVFQCLEPGCTNAGVFEDCCAEHRETV